jgi:hypothetical protein
MTRYLFFESKRLALWECFDVNCCRFLDGVKFGKLADNVLLIILMKFFRTRNAQKFSGLATQSTIVEVVHNVLMSPLMRNEAPQRDAQGVLEDSEASFWERCLAAPNAR